MKIVMEIAKFEHGTYTPRPKEGQDAASPESWLRLVGRPVPEKGAEAPEARWLRAISYRGVADALKGKLGEITIDGDKVAGFRLIVELEGEWKSRVKDGKTVQSFEVSKFELRTGPSVELSRLRRDADAKLAEASATADAGDLASAYRALEEFVSSIALRSPSVGAETQVSAENGPEERALKAFAKADGKPLSEARREEAKPAVEASAEPESAKAQAEAVVDAPVEPVVETPAIETEQPEVAAPKVPPKIPVAPRMPMLRRPPPPPAPPGMKR